MGKNARKLRKPATRFGADPFPCRSFILLLRLLSRNNQTNIFNIDIIIISNIIISSSSSISIISNRSSNLSVEIFVRCLIRARCSRSANDSMFTFRAKLSTLSLSSNSESPTSVNMLKVQAKLSMKVTLLSSSRPPPPPP